MNIQEVTVLLLGSTVVGTLISSFFTHKSNKESNDIQLLDRAYKEIERLDERIIELEDVATYLKDRIINKDKEIDKIAKENKLLLLQLEETLWELEMSKKELYKLRTHFKKGE